MERAEQAMVERVINHEMQERFSAGAVQRAVLLQHGDDPAIEPGELMVRVFVEASDEPGLIAWQGAHQEGGDRHSHHREGERGTPPEAVANIADQRPAHRPHQEAHGEDAEGCQHLGHLVLLRKEGAADGGGEVAVDGEVVPFEYVADGTGRDDLACVADGHGSFPQNPQSGSRRAASGSSGSRSIVGSSIPTGEETVVDGARGG